MQTVADVSLRNQTFESLERADLHCGRRRLALLLLFLGVLKVSSIYVPCSTITRIVEFDLHSGRSLEYIEELVKEMF